MTSDHLSLKKIILSSTLYLLCADIEFCLHHCHQHHYFQVIMNRKSNYTYFSNSTQPVLSFFILKLRIEQIKAFVLNLSFDTSSRIVIKYWFFSNETDHFWIQECFRGCRCSQRDSSWSRDCSVLNLAEGARL